MTRKLNFTKPGTDEQGVKQILTGLSTSGWALDRVYDGEEDITVLTHDEALEAIFAVDAAFLHVYEANGIKRGWIRFVLGNEPEEVVCDHTVNLSEVIDP